jgi:hypothetical protein
MFMDGGRLDMWIKSNTKSNNIYASSTPRGTAPNLKLFLMNVSGCGGALLPGVSFAAWLNLGIQLEGQQQ